MLTEAITKLLWRKGMAASVLATLVSLTPLSNLVKANAAPASVFISHLGDIQQYLPPDLSMRLPSSILLGGPADEEFISHIIVRVNPTVAPSGVTVELFSCDNDPNLCWIGSFSAISAESLVAQRNYQRHVAFARPITLGEKVRAYVMDDIPRQSFTVSSVMWQQDGIFYSARFATPERQNMLYMALSMVNSEPIYATNPGSQNAPAQSSR
jgi:hypothetical protein